MTTEESSEGSMLDLLTGFIVELRTAGLPVSLTENLDAMQAITHIPIEDRNAFKYALAATLVKNNAHWRAFETVFEDADVIERPTRGLKLKTALIGVRRNLARDRDERKSDLARLADASDRALDVGHEGTLGTQKHLIPNPLGELALGQGTRGGFALGADTQEDASAFGSLKAEDSGRGVAGGLELTDRLKQDSGLGLGLNPFAGRDQESARHQGGEQG
jgi:uncharacterized protein with von Willebrand factor type A (vWA) domain